MQRTIARGPITYRVTLESFNPDLSIFKSHAEIIYKEERFSKLNTDLRKQIPNLPNLPDELDKVKVLYGPLIFRDFGNEVSTFGLRALQREGLPPSLNASYVKELPGPVQADLLAVGNPKWYPFDKYLILGQVRCDAFVTLDGKRHARITDDDYAISFKIPGFVLIANDKEIENWKIPGLSSQDQKYDGAEIWEKTNKCAVILKRPLFFKFLAVFLGIVAAGSLLYLGLKTDPKQFGLNAGGYFLGLWNMRSILSTCSSSTPTIIDHSVLVLYRVFVAFVLFKLALQPKRSTDDV